MASEALTLAILLTLKDAASGGLDRFEAKLRSAGKEGKHFAEDLSKIRADLNRSLAIGGAGITGLKVLKDGVQVAADFQSAMTDLRTTLSVTSRDGKVDLNALGRDMLKAEAIALDLGNRLPGNTQDFVEMMQVLKQNGLQAETIFKGAGKAVGELAVANKQLPRDVAKDFAQFGQLFKLKPEEYERAADVFSRLFTSTGIGSSELIEAAKYFQGRTGSAIGISGLKDAEEMTRLFGLMRKQGMEGSMAGTAMDNFFVQYLQEKDKMKEIAKEFGIKLDFFDEKGKFKGIENLFKQLEPLQKLSDKDQAQALQGIFGQRGMAAASMMVKAGLEGWKQFNDEQDTTIGLFEKNAEIAKNYNNQMEALEGTLTNLKVAIFEPMLPGATAAVDKANELVGSFQELVKAYPEVAKFAVGTLAIGSAAMVAYSGIKILTSGVRLLRIASAFSKSEGLATMLDATSKSSVAATRNVAGFTGSINSVSSNSKTAAKGVVGFTTSVVTADGKVAGLRKNLFSLNNVFKAVLVLEAIGFTWDQISQLHSTLAGVKEMRGGLTDAGKQSQIAYQGLPTEQKDPKAEAQSMHRLLQQGNNELEKALDPSRRTWSDAYREFIGGFAGEQPRSPMYKQPIDDSTREQFNLLTRKYRQEPLPSIFRSPEQRAHREISGSRHLRENAPSLADPNVMRSFRKDVMPQMNLSEEMRQHLERMLQMAFPDSFAQSFTGMFEGAAAGVVQAFSSLQEPISGTGLLFSGLPDPVNAANQAFTALPPPIEQTRESLINVYNSANRLPSSFAGILNSANSVSISLDGLSSKISNWQPPASPTSPASPLMSGGPAVGSSPSAIPGHAVGGTVLNDGLVMAHAGNVITPAKTTRGLPGFTELMSWARSKQSSSQVRPVVAETDKETVTADNTSIFERADREPAQSFSMEVNKSSVKRSNVNKNVLAANNNISIFEVPSQSQLPLPGVSGSPAATINYTPTINITVSGNADAKKAEASFQSQLNDHSKHIERIVTRAMQNGRNRA